MKSRRLIGMTALALSLGALAVVTPAVPLAAEEGRGGRVRIVKDCGDEQPIPGGDFCVIVSSNVPQLPAGTRIYYELSDSPTPGPGYFDNNIFVFVNANQWAVGRCTGPNDFVTTPRREGLCTLTDGVGELAGIFARMKVTHLPGGSGLLFAWDGRYTFDGGDDR